MRAWTILRTASRYKVSAFGGLMSRKVRICLSCAAVICTAGIAAAVWGTIGSAASSATCLKHPERVVLAHGRSPKGERWFIASHLRNNTSCRSRELEFNFYPFANSGPSWNGGYGVPIEASLPPSFVIASHDLSGNDENSYSGVTSRKGALVEFTTGNGWVKVAPQRPPAADVATRPWLRNVSYFISYLSTNESVQRVRVRDQSGRLLYEGRPALGGFDDIGYP
jgi:hypothetical protein